MPRDRRLSERGHVTFEDLLPENLIAVYSMLGAFRSAAGRLDREFEAEYTVRSASVALSLVHAGLGVTVQPECLVTRDTLSGAATVELAEPWAVRKIHIATARGRTVSPAARAFVDRLLDRPADDRGSTRPS
ncbi:LysR substrate-binding domain-containing protein [Embleya sp. MST-111070]|uniref:LysR substrate-binding domain-containing protein n=1 Tax=Embleya sp. MST-111070 TaxID=3398231 RepID=UPI003F737A16